MEITDCIDHGQKGSKFGYGSTTVTEDGVRRRTSLHRAMYCKHKGCKLAEIDGLVVMHTCDNPRCINPNHLKLGTGIDNILDRQVKGRNYTKLTREQVIFIRENYKPYDKEFGSAALARSFGVDASTVNRAANGRGWRDYV